MTHNYTTHVDLAAYNEGSHNFNPAYTSMFTEHLTKLELQTQSACNVCITHPILK